MPLLPHLPSPVFLCRFALAAAALVANWPAAAEVSESLEYRYYTVEPRWYDSLGSALLKASPVRENGKTFMGITHWTVKWDMASSTKANGECEVGNVRTHLHSIVTLPQAVLKDPEESVRFNIFLAALRGHELGHVDSARDAARQIDQRILSLPAMATCDQLNDAANALGQAQLAEARSRDAAYDKQTGHGKTEGAVLD